MTWWRVRRVGWNRYEIRPYGSCLSGLVLAAAGLLVAAGMAVRLVPLLLDLARAHIPIALAVAAVLLLAGATRSRP